MSLVISSFVSTVQKEDTVAVNDSLNAEKLASTSCVDFEKVEPYRKNCHLLIRFERIHDFNYIFNGHPKKFHLFALIYQHTDEMEGKQRQFLANVICRFYEAFFDRCILVVTKSSAEPQKYTKEIKAVCSKDTHFEKLFQKGNFLMCPRKGLEKNAKCYQDFRKSFAAKIMNIIFNCFTPNTALNFRKMDSNGSYNCKLS